MDNFSYQPVNMSIAPQQNIIQQYQQAMQNPKAFTDYIARINPQLYQRAMQLMQGGNPQQIVMQMLQSRGLNPGMFNLPGIM